MTIDGQTMEDGTVTLRDRDSLEQSRMEAGDLLPAIERGVISWESVVELGSIVAGRVKARASEEAITLFKSNGIALEDIATALRVYNLARERGVGEEIDLWSPGC